jgi:hypothetical protein
MEKIEKFYQLRGDAVINTFVIKRIQNCAALTHWLNVECELDDFEIKTLDKALDRYSSLAASWNEEELKMHFISAIFAVADPNIPEICKTYFERPLSGVINNLEINVITDCMIAKPKSAGDPDKPYFFLQEFKQAQRFGRTDPEGQMLAAMLLAQQTNQDGKTLYGCFVIERNWFFTTLNGLDYCVSKQFDASDKTDLLTIVYALRHLKDLILNR